MKRSTTALATVLTLTAFSAGAADLRMSWWGGDSRHLATQEALKVCGEKHGHTIKPEFTGFSGHLEKVTTQLAGGTEADIMQLNWPWLPLFSPTGEGLADLSTFSDTIDLSNWTADDLATTTINGKLQGLPVSTSGRLFWFNKTTFEKAGIPLPTTIEELMAAGPVFVEKLGKDYYPLEGMDLDAMLLVENYLTQKTGKPMIDTETLTTAWTEEEWAEGINYYLKLAENHALIPWKEYAAAGTILLYENPLWADGHIAGSYQWDTTYSKFADPLQEGQELVPAGLMKLEGGSNDGVYRKPSMVISISKNSKEPKAAAEIVNCLLNEPEGIAAMGSQRGIPASKVALAQLEAAGQIEPVQKTAYDMIMSASGPAVSPYNEQPEVFSTVQDTMEMIAYGEMTPEEGAEEIVYGINDVLEKYQK